MHAISCSSPARRAQALGLLLALAVWSGPSAGVRLHAHYSGHGFPGDVSAFALHVARTDLDLDYDDSTGDETLRLRRIGVAFFEPLSDSVRLGARFGRIGFDQSERPATAGRDPVGFFAELELNSFWPQETRLRGTLDANWRYSSTDESDEDTEVEVDWQTLELRPALWLALNARIAVRAGMSVIAVDGSERVSGTERETVDFETADTEGTFATLEYHRSDGDVISARLRGGNPSGLHVSFEHRF